MADNRNGLCVSGGRSDAVYIDVSRILDSCRDKDCFEDVRVFLPDYGQEILDRATSVRARSAEILDCCLNVSPMSFNRGFYQIGCRIFVRIVCETCVGGSQQQLEGLAVVDKNVILFGSEGSVRIFRSKGENDCCSCRGDAEQDDNLPTAVLEIVDPVVLAADIAEKCNCRPRCNSCSGTGGSSLGSCVGMEFPDAISRRFNGPLFDSPEITRVLRVSLGFFSVLRMERPCQYLVNGTEYSVPDKECVFNEDDDPCSAFKRMAFPIEQFSPPPMSTKPCGNCGCQNGNS